MEREDDGIVVKFGDRRLAIDESPGDEGLPQFGRADFDGAGAGELDIERLLGRAFGQVYE